ncbi:interleukin-1 receptor-associated kinase-like 2 isoform X2 [Stegostoma tigrinum]|uniref:interleukin-1 receptor-associated kinase-like 2 isoform X2 n=1 Tax=Stegostoma tigrinum TaxID=3053191 RepID=UPI00286FFA23|nr:interleukin-1 receptor-associated kinase-like 2 isoform X2 [Stegostoma tigrinum]
MSSPYFVLDIPAQTMEEFYLIMDTLAPGMWHRFASRIIADQTELRKIESLGGNNSRTRELMWAWGMRQATVQQLLHILNEMQLYRVVDVILSRKPTASFITQLASLHVPLPETSEMFCAPLPSTHPVLNCEDNIDLLNNVHQQNPLPRPSVPSSLWSSTLESHRDKHGVPKMGEFSNIHLQESNNHPATFNYIWPLQDLKEATDNFNDKYKIGSGTFGHVYKGHRFNTEYAIKLLKKVDDANLKNTRDFFHREVENLYQLRHSNILALEGCCAENDIYCLIYHYMSNGSLESKLQCTNPADAISWNIRINIAVGTARAIQFLHESHVPLIHGNIKCSNILLDEYFVPKLGDFGLVKTGPLNGSVNPLNSHTTLKTKTLQGPLAYLPDEFIRHRWLSVKVDTFSFGIVLAEILTGIKAMDENRQPAFLKDLMMGEMEAAKQTKNAAGPEKTAHDICQMYLDTKGGPFPLRFAIQFAVITCQCIKKKRPEMKEVYSMLENLERQVRSHSLQNSPQEVEDISYKLHQLDLIPQENTEILYPPPASKHGVNPLQSESPSIFEEISSQLPDTNLPKIPCESDESDDFGHYRVPASLDQLSCKKDDINSKWLHSDSSPHSQATEDSSTYTRKNVCTVSREPVETTSSSVHKSSPARNHVSEKLCIPPVDSDAASSGSWEFHLDSEGRRVNPVNHTETTNPAMNHCCCNPGVSPLQDRLMTSFESEKAKSPSRCTLCKSFHVNEQCEEAVYAYECCGLSAGCQTGVPESMSPEISSSSNIKINRHKKKLLAKILLYEEERINSAELLSAPSLSGEDVYTDSLFE